VDGSGSRKRASVKVRAVRICRNPAAHNRGNIDGDKEYQANSTNSTSFEAECRATTDADHVKQAESDKQLTRRIQ
jgi:hypothetical protein